MNTEKSTRVLKVIEYFEENNFEESYLLSLLYNSNQQILEIVLSYAMTPSFTHWLETGIKPEKLSPPDFRQLVFTKVTNFEVEGNWLENGKGEAIYNQQNNRNFLLQDYKVEQSAEFWAKFVFAWNAKCQFNFQELLVKQRFGQSIKNERGEVLQYEDLNTGKKFDRHYPFKQIDLL